ncbi:DUF5696 domain-containing protein [Alkalihalobacillus pseudalcaliphilus]|uniref:DUF5696 domain-containing protein n=1 Tax=Alkalihalobacillus pseudalcaliphilus TaxID=79884 RepID=UPI00064DCBEC|nr:DUF5696 domain-containing protein [Alkalihalobacillus pseudalcaliphilus]KMK74699.1 hypothetical protein AB990_19615 [Alkalihalobacillus pseudalcaliphilus]
MFRKYKWSAILLVVLLLPFPILAAISDVDPDTEVSELQEELQDEALRYASNQFTLPEDDVEWEQEEVQLDGYEQIAENGNLILYVEEESLAMVVEDKRNGYYWTSGVAAEHDYQLNTTWTNLARSAATIQYLDAGGSTQSESILTNEIDVQLTANEHGFLARIPFDAGITITLEVMLTPEGLDITVPHSEIVEDETNQLISLRLYPFLGAVHKDEVAGYMFIPDGSGALIRFEDGNVGALSTYQGFVYGKDLAFTRTTQNNDARTNPEHTITMPVYGMVHGANEQGFVTVLKDGREFSEIIAYPSGVSTDFNWVTSQYHYRYEYYQPTSQSMSGFNTYQIEMNEFDIVQSITLLDNEQANYVGMAHVYQQDLLESGTLEEKQDVVDIRLDVLGGEVKTGLLWDSIHPMTEINQLANYVERLQQQGIEDMHLVYHGWTKGGLTGTLPNRFPVDNRLGGKSEMQDVTSTMAEKEVPFYLGTDFSTAHADGKGYSGRTDVARRFNAETMVVQQGEQQSFLLNPSKSYELAIADIEPFQEHGVERLAINNSGHLLFSNFAGHTPMTRMDTKSVYEQMFVELSENIGPLALSEPFDYLWKYADKYLDIPMYSSGYRYASDTVPFLQIVLKGYIPYYAPHSNFHFNANEELLRMIEFGAYPSFYLTEQPSHLLMNTPSSSLYTSQFDDWEADIVHQYERVKDSLGEVEGASITSRIVHDVGVVEIGYSNEKSIFVNYTNKPFPLDGGQVEAGDFVVVDRGDAS